MKNWLNTVFNSDQKVSQITNNGKCEVCGFWGNCKTVTDVNLCDNVQTEVEVIKISSRMNYDSHITTSFKSEI